MLRGIEMKIATTAMIPITHGAIRRHVMSEPLVLSCAWMARAGDDCAGHTKHAAAISGGRPAV
jgi:hypothetical protein